MILIDGGLRFKILILQICSTFAEFVMAIPRSIVAVDVETSGLYSNDRIVSLGAWRVTLNGNRSGSLETEYLHIIVDPGKKSHPKAEEAHGYSDWVLRHQQPFSEHSKTVQDFLSGGELIVAHNATFDIEFIAREYRALGLEDPSFRSYCTMDGYRHSGMMGRASLNAVCQQMGLAHLGKAHCALEDAWLALMVYFWLHNLNLEHIQPFSRLMERGVSIRPTNFVEPPPLPDGPLPRRRKRLKEGIGSVPDKADKALMETLLKEVRPTAILLMEVARSDNAMAAEEVEILTALIRTTSERLNVTVNSETEFQLLVEIFDIQPTQNLLTRAARALCENPVAREAFPKWLASMATADGSFSVAEREAVDRVKAAIKRVL